MHDRIIRRDSNSFRRRKKRVARARALLFLLAGFTVGALVNVDFDTAMALLTGVVCGILTGAIIVALVFDPD